MTETFQDESPDKARIILGLLESVEREGGASQRRLATELGIALGLVNAYLKRCITKGLVKVRQAPARRYAYYLTPLGFAEKSRLTVAYLSYSFDFFRQARADCAAMIAAAGARGQTRFVLAGKSDLAEIVAICTLEGRVTIVAIVDPAASVRRFFETPVAFDYAQVPGEFDAVIVTDLMAPRETFDRAVAQFGEARVIAPDLLMARIGRNLQAAP
jgi:predicted transcriptional regulator